MGLPFLGFSQGGDWCSKHSRCWLLRLYVLFVSVSQRAISFLISDAKLWRILIDSKKFCVFRSQLLRHRGVFCNKSGERWHSCRIPPLKSYSQIVNPTETFSAIRFAVSWKIRIFASDMAKTYQSFSRRLSRTRDHGDRPLIVFRKDQRPVPTATPQVPLTFAPDYR